MGVLDFTKCFSPVLILKEKYVFEKFKGLTIAIDAYNEIYRASTGVKNISQMTDAYGNNTSHLTVIISLISRLKSYGVKQLWVFDHSSEEKAFHNPFKQDEINKRILRQQAVQNKLQELKAEDNEEHKDRISSLEKQTLKITEQTKNEVKYILTQLGINYIDSPAGFEAEHVAAYLSRTDKIDAVYSADTDCIPFGAKIMIKKKGQEYEIYTYEDICDQIKDVTGTDADIYDIRKICAILGCDFCERRPRVGPKTVLKKYKSIPNDSLTEKQRKAIEAFSMDPVNIEFKSDYDEKINPVELFEWLHLIKNFDLDNLIDSRFKKFFSEADRTKYKGMVKEKIGAIKASASGTPQT